MVQLDDSHKQNSSLRNELRDQNESIRKLEADIQGLDRDLDTKEDEVNFWFNLSRLFFGKSK